MDLCERLMMWLIHQVEQLRAEVERLKEVEFNYQQLGEAAKKYAIDADKLRAEVERLNADYTEACQDATRESHLNRELQAENQRLWHTLEVIEIDACTCHERRHSAKCGSCVAEQALKGGVMKEQIVCFYCGTNTNRSIEAELAKYKAFYHESVKAHREALERLDRIANLQGDEINRAWAIANGEE